MRGTVDVLWDDGRHSYWSTHCRHGNHQACTATEIAPGVPRRPAQCKTCHAPCICTCHTGGPVETGHRITLKMKVSYIQDASNLAEGSPVRIEFNPDYQDDRNKDWAAATPAATLGMTVRAEVAQHFTMGEAVDLVITRNPDQPAGFQVGDDRIVPEQG